MKYFILLSSILTIISCSSNSNDKTSILEVMESQEKAWSNGDIEGFMNGYWQSDSLMFIGKNGIKYGWNTTLDNYKKSYPDKATMGKLEFKVIQLEVNGNNAYVLGKWSLTREKDNPNGYFTLYWKKINNNWVITIDHTS